MIGNGYQKDCGAKRQKINEGGKSYITEKTKTRYADSNAVLFVKPYLTAIKDKKAN
jgi:hypothetical protein